MIEYIVDIFVGALLAIIAKYGFPIRKLASRIVEVSVNKIVL